MAFAEQLAQAVWYEGHHLGWILRPLGGLYCIVVATRRQGYRRGWFSSTRLPVPVIIVGNITVGGTGKTPLVLWVVEFLTAHGWRPGIVSRGYGGRIGDIPREVELNDDPGEVGDEPLLLARRAGVPVAVCRSRAKAGELLYTRHGCDCLIADDGLQHYALARDLEIAVTDRSRGLGNSCCLPAGPLRESLGRLAQIPLRVANGPPDPGEYAMTLHPGNARSLTEEIAIRPLTNFLDTPVHAVAGIGYPARFFSTLRAVGLSVIAHPFPDHHPFRPEDLAFGDHLPILMTEKDAVKCLAFGGIGQWYVPVEAQLSPEFGTRLLAFMVNFQNSTRHSPVPHNPYSALP
ncbi:Tetraacyldisaccharide 4'-kinase [Gammaproteobacteria bacterium]